MPRFALITFMSIFFCTVGCEGLQGTLRGVLDDMEKPRVRLVGTNLRNLSVTKADLAFDVAITNPYDVPLPLSEFGYRLSSAGHDVLKGRAAPLQTIPAGQTEKLLLPVKVTFADVVAAAKGVKPGQIVPYDAELELIVTPPVAEPITFPLRKQGKLPIPAVPEARLASITWDRVSMSEARGQISLELRNTNAFELGLKKLRYGLWLGGTRVSEITIDQGVQFNPGKAKTLTVPIELRPADAGMALLRMLLKREATYRVEGDLEAGTPYGPITFPVKASGTTTQSR